MAVWEGILGSKTGRVGWVKCQGKEQAEGTSEGLRAGECRTRAALWRDHPGSTVGATGEDRLWKSLGPPEELIAATVRGS